MAKLVGILMVFALYSCSSYINSDELLQEIAGLAEITINENFTITYSLDGSNWENNQDLILDNLEEFNDYAIEEILRELIDFERNNKNILKLPYASAYKYQNSSPCEFTLQYGGASNINFQDNCSSGGWYTPYLGIWDWAEYAPFPTVEGIINSEGTFRCSDSYTGYRSGSTVIYLTGEGSPSNCSANVVLY